MIIEHMSKIPKIDPSAYIAPNATLCGEVVIGKNARIMFGAQIIAENGPVTLGDNCIVLENAVIRGAEGFPVRIGDNCLMGPHAHLAGCTLMDNVFVATGASVFHGALLMTGSEVRINGIVHLRSVLKEGAFVPIGWIAVGNPAKILPPDQHDAIWTEQGHLNFPKTVYGIDRPGPGEPGIMPDICRTMSERLSRHKDDKII